MAPARCVNCNGPREHYQPYCRACQLAGEGMFHKDRRPWHQPALKHSFEAKCLQCGRVARELELSSDEFQAIRKGPYPCKHCRGQIFIGPADGGAAFSGRGHTSGYRPIQFMERVGQG